MSAESENLTPLKCENPPHLENKSDDFYTPSIFIFHSDLAFLFISYFGRILIFDLHFELFYNQENKEK